MGRIHIEISTRNPLGKLKQIEIDDLKNTPCILVTNETSQEEERQYYEKIVGLKGAYIFVNSVQEARLKIVTGQGIHAPRHHQRRAYRRSEAARGHR